MTRKVRKRIENTPNPRARRPRAAHGQEVAARDVTPESEEDEEEGVEWGRRMYGDRHMKLLTIETESRFGTLWDQEQCTQFCSKDELWEAAKEEEMKIPWKDAKEGSPVP
jgi:hypothetical protein